MKNIRSAATSTHRHSQCDREILSKVESIRFGQSMDIRCTSESTPFSTGNIVDVLKNICCS